MMQLRTQVVFQALDRVRQRRRLDMQQLSRVREIQLLSDHDGVSKVA